MKLTMVMQVATPAIPVEQLHKLARLAPPPIKHEGVDVGDVTRLWVEADRLMAEVDLWDVPEAHRLYRLMTVRRHSFRSAPHNWIPQETPCPVGAERGNHPLGCEGCTCPPSQMCKPLAAEVEPDALEAILMAEGRGSLHQRIVDAVCATLKDQGVDLFENNSTARIMGIILSVRRAMREHLEE